MDKFFDILSGAGDALGCALIALIVIITGAITGILIGGISGAIAGGIIGGLGGVAKGAIIGLITGIIVGITAEAFIDTFDTAFLGLDRKDQTGVQKQKRTGCSGGCLKILQTIFTAMLPTIISTIVIGVISAGVSVWIIDRNTINIFQAIYVGILIGLVGGPIKFVIKESV